MENLHRHLKQITCLWHWLFFVCFISGSCEGLYYYT